MSRPVARHTRCCPWLTLDALDVADVRLELPRYTPQGAAPLAPVFVGTSFVFVHLESSEHRRVADSSLRISTSISTVRRSCSAST